MTYLFKQKFQLNDLAALSEQSKKVLICEPESYLSALYGHYLEAHNFNVSHCSRLGELRSRLQDFSPELLLLNVELSFRGRASIDFKKDYPFLMVVTMAHNLTTEQLKPLMNAGAAGHINRHLTRPQDVVEVVKMLLFNK